MVRADRDLLALLALAEQLLVRDLGRQLDRLLLADRVAQAQLALAVAAPDLDRAVARQRHAVVGTQGQHLDVLVAERGHVRRLLGVDLVAEPEAARLVHAEGQHLVLVRDHAGVELAREHLDHVHLREAVDHARLFAGERRQPLAQLSLVALATRVDCAQAGPEQRVRGPARDHVDLVDVQEARDEHEVVQALADAQLSRRVVTNDKYCPVLPQHHDLVFAACEIYDSFVFFVFH